MRYPRVRFTVRRMMFAVAALSLAIVLVSRTPLAARIRGYLKEAASHAEKERLCRERLEEHRGRLESATAEGPSEGPTGIGEDDVTYYRGLVDHDRREADYHAAWRRNYLRAAWRPWEPLATGPPPEMPYFIRAIPPPPRGFFATDRPRTD